MDGGSLTPVHRTDFSGSCGWHLGSSLRSLGCQCGWADDVADNLEGKRENVVSVQVAKSFGLIVDEY